MTWRDMHAWVKRQQYELARQQEWSAIARYEESLTSSGRMIAAWDAFAIGQMLEEVRQQHTK